MLKLNIEQIPTESEISAEISEIRNDNIKTYIIITTIILGMLLGPIVPVFFGNLSTENRLFGASLTVYQIVLMWVVGFVAIRYSVRSLRDESIYKDVASYELHQEVNLIRDNDIKSYIDMVAKENRKLTTFEALSLINIDKVKKSESEINEIYKKAATD